MKRNTRAFTLVEVVLALGIVACAILPVMALIPTGMGVYQDAQITAVETEIVRQVTNELQNSPYSSLFNSNGAAQGYITSFNRSYDVEGRDVTSPAAGALPTVYIVTLSATNLSVGGSPVCTGTVGAGLYGPDVSGSSMITTAAGVPLAQTIGISVKFHQRPADVFNTVVVNKGY